MHFVDFHTLLHPFSPQNVFQTVIPSKIYFNLSSEVSLSVTQKLIEVQLKKIKKYIFNKSYKKNSALYPKEIFFVMINLHRIFCS